MQSVNLDIEECNLHILGRIPDMLLLNILRRSSIHFPLLRNPIHNGDSLSMYTKVPRQDTWGYFGCNRNILHQLSKHAPCVQSYFQNELH